MQCPGSREKRFSCSQAIHPSVQSSWSTLGNKWWWSVTTGTFHPSEATLLSFVRLLSVISLTIWEVWLERGTLVQFWLQLASACFRSSRWETLLEYLPLFFLYSPFEWQQVWLRVGLPGSTDCHPHHRMIRFPRGWFRGYTVYWRCVAWANRVQSYRGCVYTPHGGIPYAHSLSWGNFVSPIIPASVCHRCSSVLSAGPLKTPLVSAPAGSPLGLGPKCPPYRIDRTTTHDSRRYGVVFRGVLSLPLQS